jgi:hypothetical protein
MAITRPGRLKIGTEIRALIRCMSKANPVVAERLMVPRGGIELSSMLLNYRRFWNDVS